MISLKALRKKTREIVVKRHALTKAFEPHEKFFNGLESTLALFGYTAHVQIDDQTWQADEPLRPVLRITLRGSFKEVDWLLSNLLRVGWEPEKTIDGFGTRTYPFAKEGVRLSIIVSSEACKRVVTGYKTYEEVKYVCEEE